MQSGVVAHKQAGEILISFFKLHHVFFPRSKGSWHPRSCLPIDTSIPRNLFVTSSGILQSLAQSRGTYISAAAKYLSIFRLKIRFNVKRIFVRGRHNFHPLAKLRLLNCACPEPGHGKDDGSRVINYLSTRQALQGKTSVWSAFSLPPQQIPMRLTGYKTPYQQLSYQYRRCSRRRDRLCSHRFFFFFWILKIALSAFQLFGTTDSPSTLGAKFITIWKNRQKHGWQDNCIFSGSVVPTQPFI